MTFYSVFKRSFLPLEILGDMSNICIFLHKIFCPLPLTINKTPVGFLLIIKYSQKNEILQQLQKNYAENTFKAGTWTWSNKFQWGCHMMIMATVEKLWNIMKNNGKRRKHNEKEEKRIRTIKNCAKLWQTMKTCEKQWRRLKNFEKTMKSNEKHPLQCVTDWSAINVFDII